MQLFYHDRKPFYPAVIQFSKVVIADPNHPRVLLPSVVELIIVGSEVNSTVTGSILASHHKKICCKDQGERNQSAEYR